MQFVKKLVISVAVLALFAVFLIQAGTMPVIVNFASEVFGVQVGEKVEEFGNKSKDVVDGDYEVPLPSTDSAAEARELLSGIETTGSTRIPAYDRDAFGKAWADVDGNGCDTRNDILARDLTNITRDGTCKVTAGTLADPYTGKDIAFTRTSNGGGVDIEHVGALEWAWQNGAWEWTAEQRLTYANDPVHLYAVSATENRAKGSKGPSEWMPKNTAFHCEYALTYIEVAVKYDLTMPAADKSALDTALNTCS